FKDSSDNDISSEGTDEEEENVGILGQVTSPLTEFLSLKQELCEGKASVVDKEGLSEKTHNSPLVSVMSHILSFLEHYSHMQRLQEQASEYRSRLRHEEARRKKQLKMLRKAYRQKMRDKLSLIENLEGIISEQQNLVCKLQMAGIRQPSSCSAYPLSPIASVGVHRLVESISELQGERNKLTDELVNLKEEMESCEKEKQQLMGSFEQQIQELKQKIQEREEELSQQRLETGITDSEKRIQHLTAENESLKQGLSVTQGLLQQLSSIPAQSSTLLVKENEDLRTKVVQLEFGLQQKVEHLVHLESQMENLRWRKEDEIQRLDDRLRSLQLELNSQRNRPPEIQYVTKTVEVDSPTTLKSLADAEERNKYLMEQVASQRQRCHQLEDQLKSSDDVTYTLRNKILAYEAEIEQLRDDLLQEIKHLEAGKEQAVKEASECSEIHLEELREQFSGVQHRLKSLQPVLKSMKTNYNSLRSQVKNFSEFYEVAIKEAKQQISTVVSQASEVNRDLLEKYRREMVLRKKYHDQLVELKGNIRVLCRVKPLTEDDLNDGNSGDSTPVMIDPDNDSMLTIFHKGRQRVFELDKVFLPHATQEEVFQEIEPLVISCIDGYNICIFAYGQTGSGKTYTMEGPLDNPGINQRALQALFREIDVRNGIWVYTVTLSVMEIYNEVLRDLLSKDPHEKLDIKINPDGSGQLHVPGLTSVEVHSFKDIRKVLALGKKNRVTHCTNMNEHSSRSHALLTVTVTGTDITTGNKTSGKLNLVDLAGSERVWKSGAEGDRLKEAQNINKSLLALGDVIQALKGKHTHVPFRNSKLTYLLQDSLGKGSKTAMVVQISSLEKNIEETVCSLKFAQRVCKVELGPASRKLEASGQ
ncbi:kinesin-like protein KIFC3, partial [Protopterus annectens]|uniref:kinesin-like protein KIFC3 n=1 Tax=Protopterus annectens TaxID=7888 RepID=UPI001CFB067F